MQGRTWLVWCKSCLITLVAPLVPRSQANFSGQARLRGGPSSNTMESVCRCMWTSKRGRWSCFHESWSKDYWMTIDLLHSWSLLMFFSYPFGACSSSTFGIFWVVIGVTPNSYPIRMSHDHLGHVGTCWNQEWNQLELHGPTIDGFSIFQGGSSQEFFSSGLGFSASFRSWDDHKMI